MRTIRIGFALLALIALPRLASADTLTGTIGALAAGQAPGGSHVAWFKFTDPALTKGCTNQNGQYAPVDYAYLYIGSGGAPAGNSAKEIYALLLISKKGAPITCVTNGKLDCSIRSCELP